MVVIIATVVVALFQDVILTGVVGGFVLIFRSIISMKVITLNRHIPAEHSLLIIRIS